MVAVYGSYGTSRFNEDSDIDIAWLPKEKVDLYDCAVLSGKISDELNIEIDLKTLGDIYRIRIEKEMMKGTILYSNDNYESFVNNYIRFSIVRLYLISKGEIEMSNKHIIRKYVKDLLEITDSMYDEGRIKDKHINSATEIKMIHSNLSSLLRIIETEEIKLNYNLPYKVLVKSLYGDKPLPYRFSRKYNDTDIVNCIDLACAIIAKFNPNAEETTILYRNEFDTVNVLKFLVGWLSDRFKVKSYTLFGGHVTFEEVESVMRGIDWEEHITDRL